MEKSEAIEGITTNDDGNRHKTEFVLAAISAFDINEPDQEISSASSSFSI